MRLPKAVLSLGASVALAAVAVVLLTPLATSLAVRAWLAWVGQQEHCEIRVGKIDAPFLRPIVLRNVHAATLTDARFRSTLEISIVRADLNVARFLPWSHGRALRSIRADGVRLLANLDARPPAARQRFDWRIPHYLLADNFDISGTEIAFEGKNIRVAMQGFAVSASELEAGTFLARELSVGTPWFDKIFTQLRGATSWQESRLSIGAVTLMRGLDIDSLTLDLAQLAQRRTAFQTYIDAFGGKLRANVSSSDHAEHRAWDVAATVSELSLAQLSDELHLADRASGVLRTCKFTFRGDNNELADASAAVWAEIDGLTWRDRTADAIMVGASLYNREVQVQQIYIKQRQNQLTLSGESALPQQSEDWLNPDFRGDISGSISDLGEFARLFGANASDFAGELSIDGNVTARDRKLDGQLVVSGTGLRLFGASSSALHAKVNLKDSHLELEDCELNRSSDFFRARGEVDIRGEHAYSATLSGSVSRLADYSDWTRSTLGIENPDGGLDVKWQATGSAGAHRGDFEIHGTRLHFDNPISLVPFDAVLEGDYAPDDIFFRQFRLSNDHAALSAFVTVAKDYLQLQTLRFDVNGKSILDGNVFVPLSLSVAYARGDLLAAASDDPNFDIDLTINPSDLRAVAAAVAKSPAIAGNVAGRIELYGPIASLAGKSVVQLKDFTYRDEAAASADVEMRIASSAMRLNGEARFSGSRPIRTELSLPLRFEKQSIGYSFLPDETAFATIDFPSVLLGKLPRYLTRGTVEDGVLSGKLSLSKAIRHPLISGDVNLADAKFPFAGRASSHFAFSGAAATIDSARVSSADVSESFRGEIDYRDAQDLRVRLVPIEPLVAQLFSTPPDCISGIRLSAPGTTPQPTTAFAELDLRGPFFGSTWSVAMPVVDGDAQTLRFCAEGPPLLIAPAVR